VRSSSLRRCLSVRDLDLGWRRGASETEKEVVAEARSDTGNDGGAALPTVVAASRVLLGFRGLGDLSLVRRPGRGVRWYGEVALVPPQP
jgi:hypothetical protein